MHISAQEDLNDADINKTIKPARKGWFFDNIIWFYQ